MQKDQNLIERNINKMVINPCKVVSDALDTVEDMKEDSKKFTQYIN